MSKKYDTTIPKNCKTFKDKTEFLIEEIKVGFSKLDGIEKKGVECAVQLGKRCLLLKTLVKKEKKAKWEKFVKKNFPHLDIRTIQRYMKLAKKVDLERDPALALLGKTLLYELVSLAGKDTVSRLLEDNDIEIEIALEDKDSIAAFKHQVDELIHGRKKAKNSVTEGDDNDDEMTLDEILSMSEDDMVKLLEKVGVDLDDDEWKTKKQLQNLLIEHFGLAGNDNDDDNDNDNNDNDNDNDNDDNDNDNNDNDNDDNQKGKIFKEFKKSTSSFLESIDSVIKVRKTTAQAKNNAKTIEKIIAEVEEKLEKLKKYQKLLLKKTKTKTK